LYKQLNTFIFSYILLLPLSLSKSGTNVSSCSVSLSCFCCFYHSYNISYSNNFEYEVKSCRDVCNFFFHGSTAVLFNIRFYFFLENA